MRIKFVLLVFMGLLLADLADAQQIWRNGPVSFQMPANCKPLSYRDKAVFAKKQGIEIVGMPNDSSKTRYALKEVIISLSFGLQEKKVSLENMKKGLDETGRDIPGHDARLMRVNGNEFLVSQNPISAKIWMYGVDQTGLNMIFGVLEFNQANRDNANRVLTEVLKGIKFRPAKL